MDAIACLRKFGEWNLHPPPSVISYNIASHAALTTTGVISRGLSGDRYTQGCYTILYVIYDSLIAYILSKQKNGIT